MSFEYNRLKGRIVEKVGSQKALAEKLGISEIAFSKKINGINRFSSDDIIKITEILNIPKEDIGDYFFTPKV